MGVRDWEMFKGELSRNRLPSSPTRVVSGLSDPLQLAEVISQLLEISKTAGYEIFMSTDLAEFADMRRKLRGTEPSPMFDAVIDQHLVGNAFWMGARTAGGACVALQAFRLDEAVPSLAEWVIGWMIGLYARRRELVIPSRPTPPLNSLTASIHGPVVYHGELWIDRHHRKAFEQFTRLGLMLALVRWQPAAIWALIGESMATRGHMIRMGYGHLEPSFLSWEWRPEGAEHREWIGIAELRHLEFSIAEMTPTAAMHQP